MQQSVGSDEVQKRPEVAPQPDRHRRYEFGQCLGVGYPCAMISALKPNLEGMPRFEVRSSFTRFVCQGCHYGPGLLSGIGSSKMEEASLVLLMELDRRGGDK